MSHSPLSTYLVSPNALHYALRSSSPQTTPHIIPLSAAWFLPNDPQRRTGRSSFLSRHIPHSRFFDIDAVADTTSPYPHMLPSAAAFARAMGRLGIRRSDTVVVYDTPELGIFSAPRVAWTLRVFGHGRVHVLDNFKTWVEMGLPVEQGEEGNWEEVEYGEAEMEGGRVVGFEEVREKVKGEGEGVQVLDARSRGRWEGKDPEPRKGLSSGHMPHSINIPFTEVLDPQTKSFLPADKLRSLFESKGVDPSKPIVSSCGTGVTAAVVDTALAEAGYAPEGRRIYDGSWTEWAMRVKPEEKLIQKVGG